jgi:lipopolysaccharide heptosyltransferase II
MQVRSRKKRILAYLLNFIFYIITLPIRLAHRSNCSKRNEPSSILIARLDHIGDVILSTPIYHSLKQRFPSASITVLCGSWSEEILKNNPYIDSCIIIDCPWWSSIRNDGSKKYPFVKNVYKTIKNIRLQKFDLFVDLRGDIRHIFLFGWLTRIPARISYTRSGGSYLLTHSYSYEEGKHEIERNYKLFNDYEPLEKYWQPEIHPEKNSQVNLKIMLKNDLNIESERYAVIFNGGRSKLRRITNDKIVDLCRILTQKYFLKCCYVGGLDDFQEGENIRKIIGKSEDFMNLCGKLTLTEVRDLIDLSKLYIGSDSSVSHLSASTTTPSVSLFGPLNPEQAMPIGDNKKVIYHSYPCSPCLQTVCVLTKSKDYAKCMEDVTVEEILHEVEQILK